MTNKLWFARNLQIFTISRLHLLPDVMFLPSNRDHISRKRILLFQIYHFLLSLNVPQLFQILVYKQRICLLGCLFLFAHHDFHQFQGFMCLCMYTCRFDFQDEGEKMQKKVLENAKMYEMSLMKKKQQFHIADFFKL